MTTNWRGVTLDNRSAAMMDEVARLCPGVVLEAVQGSYSGGVEASAGTHGGGGAIDLETDDYDRVVYEMRRVGWAAWHRTPDQSDWAHHIHGIAGPAGPGDLAPAAADQWADYLAGRNGLASGAPDDGPRDFVGVTWETYTAAEPEPIEEGPDMFLVLRKPNGHAWLICGSTHAYGLHDGHTVDNYANAGIPVVYVTDGEMDVVMKGRTVY